MTASRYRNYLQALAWIDLLDESPATAEAAEVLRESAEDLLLCRGPSLEREDPLEAAALVLTQLIVIDGTSRSLASAIIDALRQSGPGARLLAA